MAAPVDVVVVGSANLDLVATTRRLPGPGETVLGVGYDEYAGGKGLNQAVAAARCGATTALVASVGADTAGTRLIDTAREVGIHTGHVDVVSDHGTGRAMITVDDAAENTIVVIPGANGRQWRPDVPAAAVVLTQLETPIDVVLHACRRGRAMGAVTVLNPAPAADLPDELLQLCDVVVPNEHEVGMIGGIDRLHDAGVDTVVVTMGARGAQASVRSSGARWIQPPFAVDVVDTTGAGDAFCGALAARLAAGDPLDAALAWGAAAGALAATTAGAVPSLPHADDIRGLLERDRQA